MRVLINNKLKMMGVDQTDKKIFSEPDWPRVFMISERKWKITPITIPYIILITFFFILSFFIDNTQPNRTIAVKTKGNE